MLQRLEASWIRPRHLQRGLISVDVYVRLSRECFRVEVTGFCYWKKVEGIGEVLLPMFYDLIDRVGQGAIWFADCCERWQGAMASGRAFIWSVQENSDHVRLCRRFSSTSSGIHDIGICTVCFGFCLEYSVQPPSLVVVCSQSGLQFLFEAVEGVFRKPQLTNVTSVFDCASCRFSEDGIECRPLGINIIKEVC